MYIINIASILVQICWKHDGVIYTTNTQLLSVQF